MFMTRKPRTAHTAGLGASEAIEKMFVARAHFDESLLHAFAQCIGIALPQQEDCRDFRGGAGG